MKILVIGEPVHWEECQKKFGKSHAYTWVQQHRQAAKHPGSNDLIFDFIIGRSPDGIEFYRGQSTTVFFNTCTISLSAVAHSLNNRMAITLFGFNGMPTLLDRPILEVAVREKKDEEKLAQICQLLNTDFRLVDDRVGLVTPRVISMIINEAYYTVQDGTATREDIDSAMKLGTNYPFGPFEWCERIGIRNIYELLNAIYEDTRDERYKICPLLKKNYLQTVLP
jgi:3-hydroxybutyryl-CoA dehydrogenase